MWTYKQKKNNYLELENNKNELKNKIIKIYTLNHNNFLFIYL